MGTKKLLVASAGVIAGVLALSACTPTPTASQSAQINTAKVATVAWNQPFYAYNADTTFGNAVANTNILYLSNDSPNYYDKELKLVTNASFGSTRSSSDSPLTVKQTIAPTATWSDGVPVTPADLILNYAAQSGLYNNYTAKADDEGNVGKNSGDNVFFNASSIALELIKEFPVIEGNVITYKYSKPYVDWEMNLLTTGVPAHVVGKRALGIADPAQAAQAVQDAFKNKDDAALSKVANVWNLDFNFKAMPTDKELVVGTGPYTVTDLKEDQYITLSRNANYKGEHKVTIDTITIRFIPDPQASVQALQNGEVLVTQPQSTADILKAMQAVPNATVLNDVGGTYEHVDMAQNNNGPFDPEAYGGDAEKARLVREAFLQTIPRQKIIDTIIKPQNPSAEIRNSYYAIPGAPNYADLAANNGMQSTFGTGDNTDKAKDLLSQAGVKAPSVRFLYDNTNSRRVQEFQLIKESAEKAGFKMVDAGNKDWGSLLQKTSIYDACLFGWQSTNTGVTNSDANYRTKATNNFYGYSSKTVDGLLDTLLVELDLAKQDEAVLKLEQELVKDAFSITIFQFPQPTAVGKQLTGVSSIPLAPTYFWNFWEWKLA